MSYPYFDCMQRAHLELQSEGLIKPRSDQADVENDKGLLTRRGVYYANQRDAAHGLMEKTEGNNSLGYSVDWALRVSDGVGWDVTSDDGVNVFPVNGDEHPPNPDYIPRWRQPTAELAQLPTAPEPAPTPPPADTDLAAIQASIDALAGMIGALAEQVYHMRTQTWHGEVALAARMNFGVECPPMPGEGE